MKDNGNLFGGVPERSKGSDCKSDGSAFEGSNPSPSTSNMARKKITCIYANQIAVPKDVKWNDPRDIFHNRVTKLSGCSSMVEPQPSKLTVWVRFPSPAPTLI